LDVYWYVLDTLEGGGYKVSGGNKKCVNEEFNEQDTIKKNIVI